MVTKLCPIPYKYPLEDIFSTSTWALSLFVCGLCVRMGRIFFLKFCECCGQFIQQPRSFRQCRLPVVWTGGSTMEVVCKSLCFTKMDKPRKTALHCCRFQMQSHTRVLFKRCSFPQFWEGPQKGTIWGEWSRLCAGQARESKHWRKQIHICSNNLNCQHRDFATNTEVVQCRIFPCLVVEICIHVPQNFFWGNGTVPETIKDSYGYIRHNQTQVNKVKVLQ